MKFTDEIVDYILTNNLSLKNLTIILPSERAKKFLTASFYRRFNRPLLAPEMVTMDRWIIKHSNYTVIDKTRVLIKLYEVYSKIKSNAIIDSFDEFLNWAPILINDIDEIDRYLINSQDIFKNLADIKDIENWSFNREELTKGQEKFMEFWDDLPKYYLELNALLASKEYTYMGKAYRYVAENIEVLFKDNPQKQFLFAGFNALSKAELKIIKQLHQSSRAHVLINGDNYYLKDDHHEAGKFLKILVKELGLKELPFVANQLEVAQKNITVIECAQNTGQAKVLGTLLSELKEDELDETLVLLADESLIVPVINNIPKQVKKANISLGLPLLHTSIRTWLELVFSIQENKQRFKSNGMYIYDLQRFWNHPFIMAISNDQDKIQFSSIEQQLINSNVIFVNVSKLSIVNIHLELLEILTADWEMNWKRGIQLIRKMNEMIFAVLKEDDQFEKAIIQSFDQAIIDFQQITEEGLPNMNLKSFKHLFHQHWSTKSIAYQGNPINGLQVMGLLETRLLDFENIIVLGFNEGKLPPTNPIQTLIPMDLRAFFNLPTPRDKQGLFAHHFYRLLHNCKQMWITYVGTQESIGSNEASRYLMQIEKELARRNKAVNFVRKSYQIPNDTSETESKISVFKSPEIIDRLNEIFNHHLSASAINKYLNCPLNFYYQNVLEFGEEDTVEEEIESNRLGTFIHNTLEKLFLPFARHDKDGMLKSPQPSNILPKDIDGMLACYENLIKEEFLFHFKGDESAFSSGKNLLSYSMAIELTNRILLKEKEFLLAQKEAVFIEYIEVKLFAEVAIEFEGKTRQVPIKGIIDRIDSIGGKIRLIDYKSGRLKTDDVQLKKIPEDNNLLTYFHGTKHAVQLLMYCYLFKQNFGSYPDKAAIVSLVNITEGPFILNSTTQQINEIMDLFPSFIEQFTTAVFDTEVPFEHKSKFGTSYCLYCE